MTPENQRAELSLLVGACLSQSRGKNKKTTATNGFTNIWYPRQDLNLQACAPDPKSGVSTNSTTRALETEMITLGVNQSSLNKFLRKLRP